MSSIEPNQPEDSEESFQLKSKFSLTAIYIKFLSKNCKLNNDIDF